MAAEDIPRGVGMEYAFLGNSGLQVSRLSFGSWVSFSNQVDVDNAVKLMDAAYRAGVNFFDNAEVYAAGKSEEVMGKALQKLDWDRTTYVVSTKIFWGGSDVNQRGLSRKHVVEGTRAAIDRLQLDYVDIVFAHRYDPQTPMEEIVRAFNHVIERGWAFYWATSEWPAVKITEAVELCKRLGLVAPIADQCEYSMMTREKVESEYTWAFDEYKYGTTIWSPLAQGLLTGKYNEEIPEDSRFADAAKGKVEKYGWQNRLENKEEGPKIRAKLRQVKEVADELGISMAKLAIAWCLKNKHVSTVILGATKLTQLEENLDALNHVGKLTEPIMKRLDDILGSKPKLEARFR